MSAEAESAPRSAIGKWVVIVLLLVGLSLSYLRWRFVPKSNPRVNEPGSPYYSPPPK